MKRALAIGVLAVFLSPAYLSADPALITCEEMSGIDFYYCLGAPRGVTALIRELGDEKIASTPFKDLTELLANLAAKDATPVLRKRLAAAPKLPHNYDSSPVTRQDMHYAAKALIVLEGNAAAPAVTKFLGSLGEYEFTGSAWEDTVRAAAKANLKGTAEYAKRIIQQCKKKSSECEYLLPLALDLAIAADAKNLISDFAKIKIDNKEIVTSNGEATIHGKRMVLGDKELRKWFRDQMLPKVRYWRENGGGFGFPVVQPDRYLEGARDSGDMEIHAAMALGPYPEESVASLESILYFLDHPGEYSDYEQVKADLLKRIGREASIFPVEMESKNAKNTFDVFMAAQSGARDLTYRQILLRYGDAKAGNEILALFEKAKKDVSGKFAWLSAEVALRQGLAVKESSLTELIRSELSGEGDGKTVQYVMDFTDAAAVRMPSGMWSALMLHPNVNIRDRTLYNLARFKPAGYCDIVEKEIKAMGKKLNHPEIYDALFAMTLYDNTCKAHLARLARSGAGEVKTIAEKVQAALGRT